MIACLSSVAAGKLLWIVAIAGFSVGPGLPNPREDGLSSEIHMICKAMKIMWLNCG